MKIILSVAMALLFDGLVTAQTLRTIHRLPSEVNETSGIEINDINRIWSFNDSGGEARLYLCDTLGQLLRSIRIDGAWNRDWEDIAQDDAGNFYIGNIGNNSNANTDLSIFKIPNPDLVQGSSVTAEVIYFSYEDQYDFPPANNKLDFDNETLFWFNGYLYMCTKNRTIPFDGETHLYRIPDDPGTHVAARISTFSTGGYDTFNYWITAGDISPDGTKMCLLSSDKMWLFYDFTGDDFFSGQSMQINFPTSSQKEALVFVSNDEIYITDEERVGVDGLNLYSMILPRLSGPYNGTAHAVPGRIEAEAYDYGGNGNGYFDLSAANEGGVFRFDDADIQATTDDGGGYNVGWFEQYEWLQYTIDVAATGIYDLLFRTAGQSDGMVYIEIDQQKTGESFVIGRTGGWQLWETNTMEAVMLEAGQHTLRAVMESGGFNLNYIDVLANTVSICQTCAENERQIKVFPNPVDDLLHLEIPGTEALTYFLFGVDGQLVKSGTAPGRLSVIDLSDRPAGVYFMHVGASSFKIARK